VLVKWYDWLKWLLERVDSFPKNQRFIFGQRLAGRSIRVLEILVDASYLAREADLPAESGVGGVRPELYTLWLGGKQELWYATPSTDCFFSDAVYHVTSRGNGRADIFHSDEDRQRFLAQLAHHLHLCAVAVELAARLADLSRRAIGAHYGICAHGVVANRRQLATRPELLQVIETLGRTLRKQKLK